MSLETNNFHVIVQSESHSIPHKDLLNVALDLNSKVYFFYDKNFPLDYFFHFYRNSSSKLPIVIRFLPYIRRIVIVNRRFVTKQILIKLNHENCYIFAHQLQSSGYLLNLVALDLDFNPKKLFYINYGSDIYFFQHNLVDKQKIGTFLSKVTHALVECPRDSDLVKSFNSNIEIGPIYPNSFIDLAKMYSILNCNLKMQRKNLIVVKGYSDFLGRAQVILDAVFMLKDILKDFEICFVSTDREFREKSLIPLMDITGINYTYTASFELSEEEFHNLLISSKIYISASLSDGIATSSLEAFLLGNIVLTADSSEIAYFVNDPASLYLYKYYDVEGLRKSIIKAIENLDSRPDNLIKIDELFKTLKELEMKRIAWINSLLVP
jgi:hypothetical protein